MENLKQIIEGIIFTAGSEIAKKDILEKFEGLTMRELNAILKELCDKYSFEDSGVVLINLNNKVQFSSNPRYGDAIADALKKVKEKQLSAKVLDVLAIIAYKQPITRSEIEDFRSTSAEYALSVLLRAGLIVVLGRRETVGLPLEYGTTDEFLKKFNISSLAELPDAEYITKRMLELNRYNPASETLFQNRSILETEEGGEPLSEVAAAAEPAEEEDEDELPDFLEGEEDVEVIE